MSKFYTMCIGDSMSFASFAHYYQALGVSAASIYDETNNARKALRVFHPSGLVGANYALSGYRLPDLIIQAPQVDALINSSYIPGAGRPVRHYIMVLMVGTNVSDANPVTFAASVRAFCLARQAAGWKILLGTLPDRGDNATANFNSAYSTPYNAIIKGAGWAAASGVSAIIDFAADTEIGGPGASSDPAYWDAPLIKIHPNALANMMFMAPRTKAALNTLINSLGGGTPL